MKTPHSNRILLREAVLKQVALMAGSVITFSVIAQERPADMLQRRGVLHNAAERAEVSAEIGGFVNQRRAIAVREALARGLPLRVERQDGHIHELADFVDGRPLYRTTLNKNAAISTGADILRAAPYNADGAGWTVGIWDGGSVRKTHQEFAAGSRVNVMDEAVAADHSTHVGGTVGAAGMVVNAKGMMPTVTIDSYDWNNDISEMTLRGASYPGEPGKINISNHSYGYYTGWVYNGGSPEWVWYGSGTDQNGVEIDFGRYASETRDVDALAYSLPYYQTFWSAGNDRNENPSTGDGVSLFPGGPVVSYDPASHPPGDGVYRGGYDNISYIALAKNVISVGAVTDAVSGDVRSPGAASMTSFSSYGATDDGRIKPDLVANGYAVYSSLASSDTAYGTYYGTSMASPNAAGTAGQIMQWYGKLFPGHVMRASSLKALLLHTADDMGTAGPDYRFGWGLFNGVSAAGVLQQYHDQPGTRRLIEDRVTGSRPSVSFSFLWDGVSPFRATLCWTDPPGTSTTVHDSRIIRLVNNLDLRVIAPDNSVYQPWVMPFVGDWSDASLVYAAAKGSNTTDNVEQVLVATPSQPGIYRAVVSYAGVLSGNSQVFSLVVSGVHAANTVPAPLLTASEPLSSAGTTLFTLTGDNFMTGASVRLLRVGEPAYSGVNTAFAGDTLETRINTAGMASGWWNMEVKNPDGQRAVLYNAFVVPGPLWMEDFETNNIVAKGWSLESLEGVSQWALTSAKSVSPTQSVFSAGAAYRSDTCLVAPPLQVKPVAAGLQISFMHDYAFEPNDGGVLEFSIDGGGWYDVASTGSGASFVQNGYNTTIGGTLGKPADRNPLGGRAGWSGSSGGFVETVIALTDTAKYAGHSLRMRWRLATNTGTASAGWYVDDVTLSGAGDLPPPPSRTTVIFVK